jgi:LytS/YehU family sensor histidine kinase
MSIWLLAYHLYHYYQKEIKTTKENARLLVIAKQAQLDNLSAQLNPHFLFNSLNSIKSLVIENPKIARRAIDLLSDLLRSSLYQKEQKFITIKDELSLVSDYIELEKIRFEERLITVFNIDQELIKCRVPLLSIQLLVENAIKHGVDKRIEATEVAINVQKFDTGKIKISVQNQGELATQKKLPGLGLKNLQERLLIQYKGKASFEIKETSNNQVIAIIIIPINNSDENI